MKSDSITVFGGTGFLGHFIARALVGRGYRVRVAARHPEQMLKGGTPIRADVRDEESTCAAIEGARAVVNAVGLYVERRGATFQSVHVEGAERIARIAQSMGAERLVHVSGIGADNDSPSPYVRARAQGEVRVREQFGAATILRPSVLFGPGDALLSSFDRLTAILPIFPLFGSGDVRLQTVYAGDVATAAVVCLERDDTLGRTFELGGPRAYTFREIVETVLRHRNRRRLLVPMPFAAWEFLATLCSVLPTPPVTHDQITLARQDNVVQEDMPSFHSLGISPRSLEDLLGHCLP